MGLTFSTAEKAPEEIKAEEIVLSKKKLILILPFSRS